MEYEWNNSIKWIPGYEQMYAATIDGRIASYRCHPKANFKAIWLGLTPFDNGYLYVDLTRNGKKKTYRVHRLILETFRGPCPPGMQGCHNHPPKTDNNIKNLRWDTPRNNYMDKPNAGYSSKYHGVSRRKSGGKWRAQIKVKGRDIHLGLFSNEIDAARAYDKAALRYYGPNASINGV